MAKKRASKGAVPSKSDVIREILGDKRNATRKQVRAALDARGVSASDALINKIKYGPRRGSKSAAGRKRRGRGSKAEAIRLVFAEQGVQARNRDVVQTLAARRIKVTSAQVSTLRKQLANGGSPQAVRVTAHAVSYDHLLAAKVLAQRLGGIDAAQRALESLAKLMQD